ncbi:hypothetical protein [Roseimicrobium sp. ORNL1]|uniref:hypothetical protein n=1 Tax=Roseimicrobium sp. ORNL1 TaxID=2711231 RepID=UPI0013E1CF1A|nr:hypothetical protein [Roseimicrobium sp. ORNL1]QIF01945.1 hypothetical protein G5S37_10530 [Roseimicrobium sp. ORNL1]
MDSISESLASPGTSGSPIPELSALAPTHEAFAQAISLGEEPAAACQRLFRGKTAATAGKKAAALLADPAIAARIAGLQRQADHIARHHAHFTKADLITFLVETIQTPVSSVDQHHRQCQEWTRDELTTSGRRANATSQQKTQSPTSKKSTATKASSRAAKANDTSNGAGEGLGTITQEAGTGTGTGAETDTAPAPPILLRSKTKVPSKLDAAKLLATLCGWHAPAKLESNVALGLAPTVEEALTRLLR